MGNYKFRLSDMMPHAWFYKLKEMGGRSSKNSSSPVKKKHHQSTCASSSSAAAMASQTSKPHHHHSSYPRKSYYFTRDLMPSNHDSPRFSHISSGSPTTTKSRDTHFPPDLPRRSSKHRRFRHRKISTSTTNSKLSPKIVSSSVSSTGCNCRATVWTKPDSPPDYSASPSDSSSEPDGMDSFPPEFRSDRVLATESFDEMLSWSSSSASKLDSGNLNDIVIDVDKKSLTKKIVDEVDNFDKIPVLDLPPIITKPAKFDEKLEDLIEKKEIKPRKSCSSVKIVKEETAPIKEHRNMGSFRKLHSGNSPGVRLRVNSPRIGSRRIAQGRKSTGCSSRRSLSESLAIVKASFDPQKDFRESMVEMIVENNIRASKDLEDLLACYLSLNSDEYHDLIIKVFKQIWFDLSDTKLK